MDLERPAEELILRDFKEYNFGDKKFGIGQIEIIEIEKFLEERENEVLETMKKIKQERGYNCLVFAVTDILKEGSQLFIVGEEEKVAEIFKVRLENNSAWISGLMSRKKQIVPPLEENFG
jgi:manganese-dependent inorganic pyrophosphatase